jgi:hypothetical protein
MRPGIRRRQACGAAAALLAGVTGPLSCSAAEGDIAFRPVSVDWSGVREDELPPGKYVFKERRAWDDFFSRFGAVPAIDVDFTLDTVAAAFSGERSSPGHRLEVDSVRRASDGGHAVLMVHLREVLPNPARGYPAVVVYPKVVVAFRRPALPVLFSSRQTVGDR